MKNILTLLLCLVTLHSSASHISGTDVSYKQTSTPGVFEITMVVYRDCNGAPLCGTTCGTPCSLTMSTKGAAAPCTATNYDALAPVTLLLVGSPSNITPEGGPNPNSCNNMNCIPPAQRGTFTPAIEKYVFKGIADLRSIPVSCCQVSLSYSNCCRNSNIHTGSADAGFYTEIIIDRCLNTSIPNSPPQFNASPKIVACAGQPYIFNISASDPDGDSLSYEFAPSLVVSGVPVPYISPYSFDKPMPWSGAATAPFPDGIRCDAVTGDIMFSPMTPPVIPFIGVMAVLIKEWKKISGAYNLMSTTRRDFQIYLVNCNANKTPYFTSDPAPNANTAQYSFEACTGKAFCITITAKDSDLTDTTYITWEDSTLIRMGAILTTNYGSSTRQRPDDSYRLCWTPSDSNARDYPYYFSVKAKDNKIPVPGSASRAFSVLVKRTPSVQISKQKNLCGSWDYSYTTAVTPPPVINHTVQWTVAKQPSDYNFSGGADIYNTPSISNLAFSSSGKYLIKLIIFQSPAQGCNMVLYDTLEYDIAFSASVRDTVTCKGKPVTIRPNIFNSVFYTGPYLYKWYKTGDSIPLSSADTVVITPKQPGSYVAVITDPAHLSCAVRDTFFIQTAPLPASYMADSARICPSGSYTLSPNDTAQDVSYLWSTGDTTRTISAQLAGNYILTLKNNITGCVQKDTTVLIIKPRPVTSAITGSASVAPNTGGSYSINPNAASSISWSVSGGSIVGVNASPIVQVQWGPGPAGNISVKETKDGCTGDSVSLAISIMTVGIEDAGQSPYRVYPNPADNWIEISAPSRIVKDHISVADILGKQFQVAVTESKGSSGFIYRIDLGAYPKGSYIISISDGAHTSYHKITKK